MILDRMHGHLLDEDESCNTYNSGLSCPDDDDVYEDPSVIDHDHYDQLERVMQEHFRVTSKRSW